MEVRDYREQISKMVSRGRYTQQEGGLLVRYVERILGQNLPVIFDLHHLSLLIGVQKGKLAGMVYGTSRHYNCFKVRKRSGGYREIEAPTGMLKECQRWILRNILDRIMLEDCAHGFRGRRSILTNAQGHTGKNQVLNVDIEEFFPSIKWDKVFNIFRKLGYSRKVSFMLTKLTTQRNKLPQGAPTSPGISNIVCCHLDRRLSGLARSVGATYTRYADDLTFSGSGENSVLALVRVVSKILDEEGFKINERKTRFMPRHRRQEVTGLVVNTSPNLRRSQRRWLRQQIHFLAKYGPESFAERSRLKRKNLREFFYGHALLTKMLKPTEGNNYLQTLDSIAW